MAKFINEPSHTFNEYLLIPGLSSKKCIPENVSLKTSIVKYSKGKKPEIELETPLVSAIMQSVSGEKMAISLAKLGGLSFIYGLGTNEDQRLIKERVEEDIINMHLAPYEVKPRLMHHIEIGSPW